MDNDWTSATSRKYCAENQDQDNWKDQSKEKSGPVPKILPPKDGEIGENSLETYHLAFSLQIG
jgi:hypothetical protein